MNRSKYIAGPVYLVAILFVLFPLFDAFVDVLPLRGGLVSWRFGAAGTFSGAIMTPTFGLVLAFVTAVVLGQRITQRIIAVLSLIASIILVGAALLFVLDALQVRADVRPEAMTPFAVVSAAALAKIVLTAVVTTVLGIAAWKSSRKTAKGRGGTGRDKADTSVLLGGAG